MKLFFIAFLMLPVFGYSQNDSMPHLYPNIIGDIEFDDKLDKKDFDLCGETFKYSYQYFSGGLEYVGEKIAIETEFKKKYNPKIVKIETGLVRIRFIVNCNGNTDRFRIIAMDEYYNDKVFDKSITDQLLEITKDLKGWKVKKYKDFGITYYQYLIFKIANGQIIEILP